ncbi:MAG TPA: hypothetical protein VIW67_12960 [Terriglobales bacterium]|jgi:hypothetical protein
MDHHTLAAISITGTSLDLLGSLYLAYDLLGGQHGPLRVLTRAVTYSVVFGIGYGIGLGLFFGLVAGVATGITVAIELNRAAKGLEHFPLRWEAFFSCIRGVGFAIALAHLQGIRYGVIFGALLSIGQTIAYSRGVRPAIDYATNSRRPRFTKRQFSATVIRIIGFIATTLLCSALVHHVDHQWMFAIKGGLVIGSATAAGTIINPFIEYYADNLPAQRLGAFGIGVILCGFLLQSLQYWVSLLDIKLT